MGNGKMPAFQTAIGMSNSELESMGLTKREYFASLAMQGLMSNTEFIKGGSFDYKSTRTKERVAFISAMVADELLKELEK